MVVIWLKCGLPVGWCKFPLIYGNLAGIYVLRIHIRCQVSRMLIISAIISAVMNACLGMTVITLGDVKYYPHCGPRQLFISSLVPPFTETH